MAMAATREHGNDAGEVVRERRPAPLRETHRAIFPCCSRKCSRASRPRPAKSIIDGTFGAGGYTRAILEAADCRVLAFDRDPRAVRDAGQPLVDAIQRTG